MPSCTYLEGEYGQNDICIGVPAVMSRGGVEEGADAEPDGRREGALFERAVRKTNNILHEIKAL